MSLFTVKTMDQMAEHKGLTAEFARTKGAKDKGQRKKRGLLIGGGVLAGAGGAALGLRYGGAELAYRKASDKKGGAKAGLKVNSAATEKALGRTLADAKGANDPGRTWNSIKKAPLVNAEGQLQADLLGVKKAPGRAWDATKKAPGRTWTSLKKAATASKEGMTTGTGGGWKEPFKRTGQAVKGTWKSGLVGKAGVGLLGTGALLGAGAAGYEGYKAIKRRKDRG